MYKKIGIILVPIALAVASTVYIWNFPDSNADLKKSESVSSEAASKLQAKQLSPRAALKSGLVEKLDSILKAEQDVNLDETCSDETFLRRAYLRIAGRIPTFDEVSSFLDSEDASKRSKLVDKLLQSDAYVSNLFNFWADLLRVQTRNRAGPAKPYLDFIKSAIAKNMRYDKLVTKLLTAKGAFFEKGNGAVGYLLRDFGMPEDSVSNSVQVFLGTRIGCAQCHDHPAGIWTRKQYYQMVAFNGGVSYYLSKTQSEFDDQLALIDYRAPENADIRGPLMNIAAPLHFGIVGSGTGLARLPEDYQYPDGKPLEVVEAKTIFDADDNQVVLREKRDTTSNELEAEINQKKLHLIKGAEQIGSRRTLAKWMTSKENPQFARVMSNRLWKLAMGRAIYEPVDNFTPQTQIDHPEIIDHLEQSFKDLNFDIKAMLSVILKSKLFQSSTVRDSAGVHPGPVLERMRAEQIWDSLLALTVDQVDKQDDPMSANENFLGLRDIYESYEKIRTMHPKEIRKMVTEINENWKKNPSERVRYYFRLDAQPARFRMHDLDAMQNTQLLRASELESPAPPGHFLREFGQSNREQIDNGNREISATQWLEMMNGFVDKQILSNPESVLMRNVAAASTPAEKVDTIFLSVLTRKPNPAERKEWLRELQVDTDEGTKELIWTLVNSSEFIFIQ